MHKQCFLLLLLLASFLPACKKDADEAAELLQEAEAAELVEIAVADRSAGVEQTTQILTDLLTNAADYCGQTHDTTLQCGQSIGPVTSSAGYAIEWTVTCNNLNVPQSAQINLTSNRQFDANHWEGAGNGTGELTATGLNPAAAAYAFNGAYTTAGQTTGSIRQANPTFTCTTQLNLTNLTVRKSDDTITGGTAAVTIAATAPNGATQTLTGSLVFNGDGTATVTIQGYSYTFDL